MKTKLLLFFCWLATAAQAQRPQQLMPEKTRLLLVLDASGSMLSKWDNDLRINIAKDKIAAFVDSLRRNPNVEMALRVYGHQFDSKQKNCTDSKLEVGFAANNHVQIKAALTRIAPKGTTPIAYSLEQAIKDFPPEGNYRNVIIMITDGIEACGGDPCAISLGLQKNGIALKPFIIGLGVGKDFTAAFNCVGKAYDARSAADFQAILGAISRQILGRTTVTVELTDAADKPIEKDVNMTFINNVTGKAIYDLIHFRDTRGRTDTLVIDPVINYDIEVGTIPVILKKDVQIEGGKHNVIRIRAPQGLLTFKMQTPKEYGNLKAIIRQAGKSETLYVQEVGTSQRYLAGNYDVEVLTTPRTLVRNVTVRQGQTTEVPIEQPGILTLNHYYSGIASLYKLNAEGQEWIENYTLEGKVANIAMQPGNYKIVFRANEAKGAVYTVFKRFTIQGGKSVTVDVLK
ncbi:vWA domain-containing protein [Rhodoflexus caldus]|uniref:vWA domain-containing protein n=1 Tax=Rhodoflexus caldus TaxID=2891236 RepID=UPI002029E5E7|nr:VWA domain-containing protein [Rhodoflexus caldus]